MKTHSYLIPTKFIVLFLMVISLFNAGCDKDDDKKDDPVIPNEEEVITTLRYTLVPVAGGEALVFNFRDIDGDGGNTPVISVDTLSSNTTYSGTLLLLNESVSPADTISQEVLEEDESHQFFFKSSAPDVTISYDDLDGNGFPVGLKSKLSTTGAGNGQLTITLRHQPVKSASGVSAGDIANAGGETDIEVNFNLLIK